MTKAGRLVLAFGGVGLVCVAVYISVMLSANQEQQLRRPLHLRRRRRVGPSAGSPRTRRHGAGTSAAGCGVDLRR